LRGDPDELNLDERADKINQIAIYSTLNKVCENCRVEGHKIWECPVNKPSYQAKPIVQCEICLDYSHPTQDCPQRRSSGTKADRDTIAVQSEFHKFVQDIRKELSDKPNPHNPGSYLNFVTNTSGVKYMIANSPANQTVDSEVNINNDPLATIFPNQKKDSYDNLNPKTYLALPANSSVGVEKAEKKDGLKGKAGNSNLLNMFPGPSNINFEMPSKNHVPSMGISQIQSQNNKGDGSNGHEQGGLLASLTNITNGSGGLPQILNLNNINLPPVHHQQQPIWQGIGQPIWNTNPLKHTEQNANNNDVKKS